MHGLPTIHKLNDAEARRIMEEHGYDTSEWAHPNPLGFHDVNPVRVVDSSDTLRALCGVAPVHACLNCPYSDACPAAGH